MALATFGVVMKTRNGTTGVNGGCECKALAALRIMKGLGGVGDV